MLWTNLYYEKNKTQMQIHIHFFIPQFNQQHYLNFELKKGSEKEKNKKKERKE